MKENLLKYFKLKATSVSISDIKKDFNIESDEELDSLLCVLNELEKKAKIFVDQTNRYILFPNDERHVQGKLLRDKRGNYLINGNNMTIYINEKLLNGAMVGDTVLAIKSEYSNGPKKSGKVKKIIARADKKHIFECRIEKGIKTLVPIDCKIYEEIVFNSKEMSDLVEGTRVLLDVSKERVNGNFIGNIYNIIGHKDDPNMWVKEIAISCGASIGFSPESLEELKTIPNKVSKEEIAKVLDLRDKQIFTIDKETTKDMDDAISLDINKNGNYVLGVYIANVSHYVKPGMKLYEEAIARGTSIYALEYCVPMLPHKISNGICSLNEGECRLAKACIMEIDKSGRVVDYRLTDCVINSKKKMSYNKVNQVIEQQKIPTGYEKFADTLNKMNSLYRILDRRRNEQGKLDFYERELDISQDENGNIDNVEQRVSASGEKLIENFMVLANETVASHYSHYPFVYRVHNKPNEETIKGVFEYIKSLNIGVKIPNNVTNPIVIQNILMKIREIPEYEMISDLILKGMTKAFYDINNVGHFALASETYTHFTSPIRRANDLTVHTLMDLYDSKFDTREFNDLEARLKAICVNASNKEEMAETIERRVVTQAVQRFLQNNIGNKFVATILYIGAKSVTVKLDNGIIGSINMKKFNNQGYSYKTNNTMKFHDSVLSSGSHIITTVLDPSLYHNQITFGFIKENVKELKMS